MKTLAKICAFFCLAALLSNCASIVSKSNWPIAVTSNPSGLQFSVTNRDGRVIHQGITPSTITLPSGAGYFRGERYTITTSRNGKNVGSATIVASLNGWYVGNIVFGGLIGLLIVDPVSGAMYALPKQVHVAGAYSSLSAPQPSAQGLEVVSIDSISASLREQLVRL